MKAFIEQNKTIFLFFGKLLLLAVLLITVYFTILKPTRVPDKILTETIASGTVIGVNILFPHELHVTSDSDPKQPMVNIRKNGHPVIRIWDVCNGLELIFIYLSLIILLPYKVSRKLIFGVVGTMVIIFANILRCIALYWIYIYHRNMFEFNHHYVFTIVIYLVIFYAWLQFTKKGKINEID